MREGGGKGEGGEAREGGGGEVGGHSRQQAKHHARTQWPGSPPLSYAVGNRQATTRGAQQSSGRRVCGGVALEGNTTRKGQKGGGERRRRRDVLGVNGRHDEGAGADGALAGGTVCDDPRRYVRPLSSQGGRRPARHGCRRGVAWRGVGVAWATHSATPDGRCRQRDGFKTSAAVRPQRGNVKTEGGHLHRKSAVV